MALTIDALYPQMSNEERREAQENLDRYLLLAVRMYERIRTNPEAYARFKALTDPARNP